MDYIILGLLLFGPNTIYGLRKSFEQGISMFYSPSLGSLQSASKKLKSKEWIVENQIMEHGRVKNILTITDTGIDAFFEWMWEPLDENNLEVTLLSRLFFMGLMKGKSEKLKLLNQLLENVNASFHKLNSVNHELEAIKVPEDFEDIFFYQKKVLQYGIDTHAFGLTWLKNLIVEIEHR
jgi:PadR family transcriptional regulator, regulatory protein AphA